MGSHLYKGHFSAEDSGKGKRKEQDSQSATTEAHIMSDYWRRAWGIGDRVGFKDGPPKYSSKYYIMYI